jgi:sugar phosphate isomerase/epimerase
VRQDVRGWAGRLDERVRGRGIEIADLVAIAGNDYATTATNHPDPVERERSFAFFLDMLELAERLQAPGLTMIPGIDWPGEGHEQSLARLERELEARVQVALDRGIRYSIEAHMGSVCASPADALRVCENVPGLELTLDYTHFIPQGYVETDVDPLLVHTRHLHARGTTRTRIQAPYHLNEIDYDRIVAKLRDVGYSGHILVEYVCEDGDDMNDVDVLTETLIMRDVLSQALRAETPETGVTSPDHG